jgi:hypothetical protein
MGNNDVGFQGEQPARGEYSNCGDASSLPRRGRVDGRRPTGASSDAAMQSAESVVRPCHLLPPPPCGEGRSSERSEDERGGGDAIEIESRTWRRRPTPTPTSFARRPSPQGGGWEQVAPTLRLAPPIALRVACLSSIFKQPTLRPPCCLKGAGCAFSPVPSKRGEVERRAALMGRTASLRMRSGLIGLRPRAVRRSTAAV